jgi:ubiquinone/menaquinone biosynthesis C-methylase UbiE
MSSSSFPELYERELVEPLFRPWAEDIVTQVELTAGERVLDIACGTGIVARLAKKRVGTGGSVVGVDSSPQMLSVARSKAPEIDWREGSAVALPVAAGETFDVVTCQQGLQFFPDKPAASREMYRVLRSGGRLAVATWRPLDEVPLFRDLHGVAVRHLGEVVDQRHSFGDAGDLHRLFEEAGFRDVGVDVSSKTIRFANVSTILRLNTMALVGMSAASKSMSDADRARVVETIILDSESAVAPYRQGDGIAFELAANVATARA